MPPIKQENAATMTAPTSLAVDLRKRLRRVLVPWSKSKKQPPFTAKELFVIALLCRGRPMTASDVMYWIVDRFPYYEALASDESLNSSGDTHDMVSSPTSSELLNLTSWQDFRSLIGKVPREFDLPLIVVSPWSSIAMARFVTYDISAGNGERVLASILNLGVFDKIFPFFDLPPELRNVIYEMVFRYPISGLSLEETRPNGTVYVETSAIVLTRSMVETTTTAPGRESSALGARASRTLPIKSILSPLLVSRQFYKEAASFFYVLNNFRFSTPKAILAVLPMMPAQYVKHISHITFSYDRKSRNRDAAFKLLGKLEGLRKLEIYYNERSERNEGHPPRVGALSKIRGLEEVKVIGCPTLEGLVKDDMLKPKLVMKAGASATKKRNAGDDGELVGAPTRKSARIKNLSAGRTHGQA